MYFNYKMFDNTQYIAIIATGIIVTYGSYYIDAIEEALSLKAIKELLPLQLGDVPDTHANVKDLIEQFDYKPTTTIQDGIQRFVDWYRSYYKV